MIEQYASENLIEAILQTSSAMKQRLGRRFAYRLGLNPGPLGKDDGVDGFGIYQSRKIYFQCRLSRQKLGTKVAKEVYSDLDRHQADFGVILSGVGFTDGFVSRLDKQTTKYRVHCLALRDIFLCTDAFNEAVAELPPLRDLDEEAKRMLQEE